MDPPSWLQHPSSEIKGKECVKLSKNIAQDLREKEFCFHFYRAYSSVPFNGQGREANLPTRVSLLGCSMWLARVGTDKPFE